MDGSAKRERKLNPREKANLLSKITFFFAYTTFRLGLRRELEEDDIYEIVKSCDSATLGSKIEKEWDKEKRKRNPKFIIPVIKIFGLEYFLYGLTLFFVDTSMKIAKPLLIGKIVSYFTPNQTELTQHDAVLYSTALICCIILNTIFIHSYFFGMEQIGLKVKTAICSLIYRKSLTLNFNFTSQAAAGQAVTLMSKDVISFDYVIYFVNQLLVGIIQIVIMTFIMYKQIGISAVAGTSMLLLFIPVQVYLGKKASSYKLKTAEKSDQRVQLTQEVINAIRIIKMYTWELFFCKLITVLRRKELQSLRVLFYIKALGISIGQLSSKFALYTCVMLYISLGYHITAEKAFVVTGCFEALRAVVMYYIPIGISFIAELKSSSERITNFLQLEEVNKTQDNQTFQYADEAESNILIRSVSVRSDKGLEVLSDINLEIKSGLTVLTGSVGAGKSTLLKMILGDVRKSKGIVEVTGKISYASQEPWLFPGTVKQNIVFSEWFDQKRYHMVIKACALKKDLDTFPNGDRTCVTDRGLNLSRGQKARITLARAVYKLADVYLLDDCLSAVDTHVGKHIFYKCIKDFLKNKICFLVTHQQQCLKEADNIVVLNNGLIKFQGNYSQFKKEEVFNNSNLKQNQNIVQYDGFNEMEIEKLANDLGNADATMKLLVNNVVTDTINVYGETKEEGVVKKEVYYTYFMSGGGFKMIFLVLFVSIMAQIAVSWSEYFISSWVDMEQALSGFRLNQTTNSTEYIKLQESHDSVMKQYSFVIFAATAFTLIKGFAFFFYCTKISANMHHSILSKIFNAGMMFFDRNLSGNILNRFSRDLGIIDDLMPYVVFEVALAVFILVSVLIIVSLVNPFFLLPSAFFAVVLIFARRLYMPTGRSIRRLQGTTRSAVIGHLNATLEGLTTIRASQAQNILRKEFDRHQDLHNSASYMYLSTTRAFGFYLDTLCAFYITVITFTFLFFKTDTLAGKVGLALTQALALTGVLQWAVRQWAELENQMTSTERILEYTKIEPEDKHGEKPNNWPNFGKIVYNDVNMRYSPTSDRVLKNITFTIEPNQKIGVVGRTGAGKSSIISTLFRMYDFRGVIIIDELDINNVAIEYLRSKISVIPQDPVLFSGTIRTNLDPQWEYTDKTLWDALEEVEMKKLVGGLDSIVCEGGSNFSIGQRQLLSLARAIVRNNKILVLDEATANVDPQTDALIQRTIRKRFYDCTVITIAHRLHTVMDCDKVLIMDSGEIIEYDQPKILLNNQDGMFYKMVKEAGLL